MGPSLKSQRSETPDAMAPDGAEIRVLLDRPQGATRLSLAEALIKPGERTACVSHRTIEELWYIVRGAGCFHRLSPDGGEEQTAHVAPGDALLIPTGYRFWVENTGPDDLVFLCCGTPPWPGHDEAIVGQRLNTQMRGIDLALIKAVAERDTVGTEQLLNAGADPNTEEEGEQGLTVLMLSVNASRSDIARLLLEHGANPNKRAEGQWTPLIEASYQGYPEIVRLLLQHGADPHIKDLNGATAPSQANDQNVYDLLRSYGAV